MNQSKSIPEPLHSELLHDAVTMVVRNHLSYDQAEMLFNETLDALKCVPYRPLQGNQEEALANKGSQGVESHLEECIVKILEEAFTKMKTSYDSDS